MTDKKMPPPINPETKIKHDQQFWLQIMLPVLLGSALMIAAGVFAACEPGDRPATWAHISTILMVIMMFGVGILLLSILILAIFGSDWLLRKLPNYSYIAQIYINYFGMKVNEVSTSATKPVVGIRTVIAGFKKLFNLQTRKSTSSRED